MTKKKKIAPEEGMLVAITLSEGYFGLGSIAKCKFIEDELYETIWALYDIKSKSLEELESKIPDSTYLGKPFMVCGMDYEELEKGKWPVIGTRKITYNNIDLSDVNLVNKLFRESISGASFIGMFTGLRPWDMFKDPEALDKRLLPGYSRPTNVKLKTNL